MGRAVLTARQSRNQLPANGRRHASTQRASPPRQGDNREDPEMMYHVFLRSILGADWPDADNSGPIAVAIALSESSDRSIRGPEVLSLVDLLAALDPQASANREEAYTSLATSARRGFLPGRTPHRAHSLESVINEGRPRLGRPRLRCVRCVLRRNENGRRLALLSVHGACVSRGTPIEGFWRSNTDESFCR